MTLPLDVEGPVQAEVFTVVLADDLLSLTGPCGADPWLIETAGEEHPLDSVKRIVESELDDVWLVHSTSWRWEEGAVTLSFVVVIGDDGVGDMEVVPVERAGLARSTATEAPSSIEYTQVLEHGLRHLSWLAREDEVVKQTLTDDWHRELASYLPEPFQQLGGGR